MYALYKFKVPCYNISMQTRKSPRSIFSVAEMDPALEVRIKMYAVGRGIPIYKAFAEILWKGLESVASDPIKVTEHSEVLIITRNK